MDIIYWVIIAVVVIGVVWFLMSRKKGAPKGPSGPAGPPPETPAM